MNRHIIRTSSTDSVKGVATKQNIDVNLHQTAKVLPFPNVSSTISQRSVYEEERQAGNKFRLILTVVPYCTNVLFNSLTEIIKDEGSDNPIVITDANGAKNIGNTYGLSNPSRIQMIADTEYSSNKHGNFKYHPGYDFFNNHILRNKSFKLVNIVKDEKYKNVFNTISDYARDRSGKIIEFVKRKSINDINGEQEKDSEKHLYLVDDILKIDESINQNLYQENGWWGFNNNTTIDTKNLNAKTKMWESMDISHVLNDRKSCEFIDLYPDRTLFSFTPKYNKYKHTEENNWNIIITYPYKNIYNHPICLGGSSYIKRSIDSEGNTIEETISEGNRWMGLKVMNVRLGDGKESGNRLYFRTYTKHGMEKQDFFYLYYTNPYEETDGKYGIKSLDGSEVYYESENFIRITNTGDFSQNNREYTFYTSDLSIVSEIYKYYIKFVEDCINNGMYTKDIPLYKECYEEDDHKSIYIETDNGSVLKYRLLNKILNHTNFRIRHSVMGVKSTYYLRLLRKIPNLRASKREMNEEEKLHKSKFNGVFDNYVKENASDIVNPNLQRLINNEQYKMGFASSIYNDDVTQITFMDGVDTKGLTDNLGRPLSEIFYTVVKNNAGYEAWYDDNEPKYRVDKDVIKKYGEDYTIEFSHCFGKVTSGLEMYFKKDDSESVIGPVNYLKKLSSANHISNIINEPNEIKKDDYSNNLDDGITYRDTFFYGDLVEFNSIDFKEKVLSNIMHRFNTAQRETINNKHYSKYLYQEIVSDDFDRDNFKVEEYSAVHGKMKDDVVYDDYNTISRPEGYIYKANYSIPIREFTDMQQDGHYSLRIRNVKPIQNNGIFINVTTTLNHQLNDNDIIFICDDEKDIRYVTRCVKTINSTNFLMSPNYEEIITNATDFEDVSVFNNNYTTDKRRYNWLELCDILNKKYEDNMEYPNLVIRRKNNNIPDYATYIGRNQYVWRNIINIGDDGVKNLPDYVFANGYFYITQRLNFFLKRQDPFGNNGLLFDGETNYPYFPNDPSGEMAKDIQKNNAMTKDTTAVC